MISGRSRQDSGVGWFPHGGRLARTVLACRLNISSYLYGSINLAAKAQADNESSNFGTIYKTYARHTLWCPRSIPSEQNTVHVLYLGMGRSTMHEDVWNTTEVHRAIQKRIGETLSAGYDLSTPLPDGIRILLGQLDQPSARPLPAANGR
jgi:hypothetical protein